MTETETMKQMRESCERIRDRLTMLADGGCFCPNCGKTFKEDRDSCDSCGNITKDLYGYVHDNLGASVTVDAYDRSWFESVRITFATGGPGIYVDTGYEEVQGRWWGECVDISLEDYVCEKINDCFRSE